MLSGTLRYFQIKPPRHLIACDETKMGRGRSLLNAQRTSSAPQPDDEEHSSVANASQSADVDAEDAPTSSARTTSSSQSHSLIVLQEQKEEILRVCFE
jgi:hypothetical protein